MNSIAEKKEKCEPELIGDRAFQMMINGASGVYEKETGRERGEGRGGEEREGDGK